VFDGGGVSKSDLDNMDLATFHECLAAKTRYVEMLKRLREEAQKNNK